VLPLFAALVVALASRSALASTAYGDLNNFDVVNDTGTECHGFEIELDDLHSTDITYTYDWNHYGAPTITEDNSDPVHPKVLVRYAAKYSGPTNSFSAYTAVPSTMPSPTDGHQCTNPSVNFGCEHFGVGHYGAPTAVRYHWLIEDAATPGGLIRGPAVNVATPTWTYFPPAPAQVAQVQAVILAPPPPPAPVYEFGDAMWVKSIVTTSHNNQVVELKDLVSDDPNDPSDENWANGEPDEVEVEWHLLQTEFNNPDGANNELAGANEELPNGDEVITRRYEFYKYVGPLDPETNEAKCDNYPQVSDPADPQYKPECDPATVAILGDYIGAQMAGFNVEAALGLIDHLQDGDLNQLYTTRTVVVGGNTPYVTSVVSGALPAGLSLDSVTGVLSGTPTAAGVFSFTVTASDADGVQVTKDYTMSVTDQADACPDDPAKTEPGLCGCGVPDTDGDGDGAPDCSDQCANDPDKVAPGVCGCGVGDVDSDGDGALDCNDQCPGDAGKAIPGVCGCGTPDTDSDGDGTMDCHDECASDPGKIHPGACGCGVPDTDSDGDLTPDCNDLCPSDPAKSAPGACGCGVPDVDSNSNGLADCQESGQADLSMELQRIPSRTLFGIPVLHVLRVTNAGPNAAASVIAELRCSGIPYAIFDLSKACATSAGAVTCAWAELRARQAATTAVLVVPRAKGTLRCTARTSSATPDPNPANQSKTVETRVH
jgi:hypothetical protein